MDEVTDIFSSRQLQVFRRLGLGMSTREIADEIHLSVKTIESHIEVIKVKLGVDSVRKVVVVASIYEYEQRRAADNDRLQAQNQDRTTDVACY